MESGGIPDTGEHADEGVLVWNGVVARVPPLVVRASSADDVAAALRLARDQGLLLRIEGRGPGAAGSSTAERSLTLDLSCLPGVTVHAAGGGKDQEKPRRSGAYRTAL